MRISPKDVVSLRGYGHCLNADSGLCGLRKFVTTTISVYSGYKYCFNRFWLKIFHLKIQFNFRKPVDRAWKFSQYEKIPSTLPGNPVKSTWKFSPVHLSTPFENVHQFCWITSSSSVGIQSNPA